LKLLQTKQTIRLLQLKLEDGSAYLEVVNRTAVENRTILESANLSLEDLCQEAQIHHKYINFIH
jgi:hypothetical protein